MNEKTLLAIFAHTDDETLLSGPLLAMCAARGMDVRVLSVAGGHDDRYERFILATQELGVTAVYNLRYDGTAYGSEAGDEGGMSIAAAPQGELASRILGRLEEVGPDVVITHSGDGDYGHPDHVAVHRAVVQAVDRYAPGGIELYALAWPGVLPRLARRFMSGSVGEPAAATTAVRVGRWVSARRRAARHYGPEIAAGPLPMRMLERLPAWAQRPVFGKASLTRLRPESGDTSIFG